MHTYKYTLKLPGGKAEVGTLKAADKQQALRELKNRGAGQVVQLEASRALNQEIKLFSRPPNAMEMSLFCSNLGMMFDAKVRETEAIEASSRTTENQKLQEALGDVKERVERGQKLTHALNQHPEIFDRSFIALLTAAVATNTVPETLERLSTLFERNHKVGQEVKGALVQPMITILVALVVVFLVTIMVIPQFKQMLTGMNVPLPIYTVALLRTSEFMRSPWVLAPFAAIIGGVVLLRRMYGTPNGRRTLDAVVLRIPKLGTLIRLGALARVNRTLATLLTNGVGKVEALEIAARASGNSVLEEILLEGREHVAKGSHLYQILERYPKLFPATITGMVRTGEEQGELARMLDRVADFYERQVEQDAKNLTKFVEPLMFVLIGGMVMGLLMALMTPIMSVVDALS